MCVCVHLLVFLPTPQTWSVHLSVCWCLVSLISISIVLKRSITISSLLLLLLSPPPPQGCCCLPLLSRRRLFTVSQRDRRSPTAGCICSSLPADAGRGERSSGGRQLNTCQIATWGETQTGNPAFIQLSSKLYLQIWNFGKTDKNAIQFHVELLYVTSRSKTGWGFLRTWSVAGKLLLS